MSSCCICQTPYIERTHSRVFNYRNSKLIIIDIPFDYCPICRKEKINSTVYTKLNILKVAYFKKFEKDMIQEKVTIIYPKSLIFTKV